MVEGAAGEVGHRERVARAGGALLAALAALEDAFRRIHPPELPALRRALAPPAVHLAAARAALREGTVPEGRAPLHEHLDRALSLAGEALESLCAEAAPLETVPKVLAAMGLHARAQETLFPLRRVFPPVSHWFLEPAARARAAALDPDPPAPGSGLHVAGDPEGRGGFHLYVPESCGPDAPRPLVVALHGAFGHGRDFLWTWLREARSRRCLLMAPTSRDTTWSLQAPELDGAALRAMVAWVAERFPVDRERVLLTGLSDGATFALRAGLAPDTPFTALAPVAGVLHPAIWADGSLAHAAGRRIRLVHGARDWMFPVALAREAAARLEAAGAEVVYREIPDLSHTWPREENGPILAWLDPDLALP